MPTKFHRHILSEKVWSDPCGDCGIVVPGGHCLRLLLGLEFLSFWAPSLDADKERGCAFSFVDVGASSP